MESHFLIYKISQFIGPNFLMRYVDRKKKTDKQLIHPKFALERSGSNERYLYREFEARQDQLMGEIQK